MDAGSSKFPAPRRVRPRSAICSTSASRSSAKTTSLSVAGMLGPLLDEVEPVLGRLPHGLGVVWDEPRRRAEVPFVLLHSHRVAGDRDYRIQINGHARGW